MRSGILPVVLAQFFGLSATAADPPADLTKLSDRLLVDAYKSAGLSLAGTADPPRYGSGLSYTVESERRAPFERAKTEIVRRGKPPVPALLDLLREQAVTNRPPDKNGFSVNLTWDALELLTAIGDPRAVPVVADLLDGMDGRASVQVRYGALVAIEQLTFCSMRKIGPSTWGVRTSVPHPSGIKEEFFKDLDKAARLYRDWLAGEGKDPSRWLDLARRRALDRLGSDDPDAIYCAAEFLFAHGLEPEAVVNRLGKLLEETKPGARRDWSWELARYGPLARPYAKALIRVQKEHGDNAWSYYARLREVSGDEIMGHLFGVLPRISEEVEKLKADPKTPRGFSSSDPRGWWFSSLREVQLACDRWAGRRFDTDAERVAWWKANRRRPREEWLAENLETVVKQADAGEPWANWVAHEVLPDLPPGPPGATHRAKWLAENRPKLKYDSKAEALRLMAGVKLK